MLAIKMGCPHMAKNLPEMRIPLDKSDPYYHFVVDGNGEPSIESECCGDTFDKETAATIGQILLDWSNNA